MSLAQIRARFLPLMVARLPKLLISRFVGVLVHIELPALLAGPVVEAFRRFFRIDLSEAVVPPEGFPSIGALFTRDLKPGARPLPRDSDEVVIPVDGRLREYGTGANRRWNVKGLHCTVSDLLGGDALASRLREPEVFHFYLSPPDYHHVHAPVSGEIIGSRYIPGTLWPVNDWAMDHVEGLIGANERLAIFIESSVGLVAVVMVGALNVGRMTVAFDSWVTNTGRLPAELARRYEPGLKVQRGDRLGTFHMGSSVVLIFEKRAPQRAAWSPVLGPCRWGSALLQKPATF